MIRWFKPIVFLACLGPLFRLGWKAYNQALGANPSEVITEQVVQDVFGLAVKVIPDPVAGTPMVVPIGRHTTRTEQPSQANPATKALAASAAANGICRPTRR